MRSDSYFSVTHEFWDLLILSFIGWVLTQIYLLKLSFARFKPSSGGFLVDLLRYLDLGSSLVGLSPTMLWTSVQFQFYFSWLTYGLFQPLGLFAHCLERFLFPSPSLVPSHFVGEVEPRLVLLFVVGSLLRDIFLRYNSISRSFSFCPY